MLRRRSLISLLLLSWTATAPLPAQSPARPSKASPPPTPTATAQPSAAPTTSALIGTMELPELKEAVQLLKDHYINAEALKETELSRATFEGLLTRLGRGVILLPDAAAAESSGPAAPFFGEILDGHIGYARLGNLDRPNLEALDNNLQNFAAKKVNALVIDLRASPSTNDFSTAAEFAKRFCAKGKILFTVRKTALKQEQPFTSDRDPVFQGLSIILADGDTAGAAEAIAGVVHLYNKALIIGQPTAGRALEYSDLKLPSGKVLRVAVGEAILPEGRPLFPGGLRPDVPVEMAAVEKREIFQQSREKGMMPFVVEDARPHLNEAALIAGRNPEIEAMENAQRRGRSAEKPSAHDLVLQRALDLVTSIEILQKR